MKFITFDTETTGIDPIEDRLVELAGVCRGYDDFTTLVNPERDIPPEARAIHHIGPEDVEGAQTEAPTLYDFFEHFGSYVGEIPILVAHNAKFDRGFVRRIDPLSEQHIRYICTMRCAWMLFPDAPGFSNQVLRYWLGLEPDVPSHLFPHRALYDCIVTQAIFEHMLTLTTADQMLYWTENLIELPRVMFGKHKGKQWSEVDYGYLKWIKQNMQDDPDCVYTAEREIKRRYK